MPVTLELAEFLSTYGEADHITRDLGFSPSLIPPSCLLPLMRELAGSPDFHVESIHTCARSLTPPKPTISCHIGTVDVAFPIVEQGLPSN